MSRADETIPIVALAEIVDDGLFVLGEDGQIIWANSAFSELVDIDLTDLPIGSFTPFLSDDVDTSTLLDAISDETGSTPITIQTESRPQVPCEITGQKLCDGRYVGCIRDVSALNQKERELDRYRTVLDTVKDAVYITDENRRFTWVNAATERMFGFDRDEDLGRHLFEFLDEQQIEVAKQNIEYLLADNTPDVITFEMNAIRKDGTRFPVETRATLLPGDGFEGTVGIIRDISHRKEREEELERKNERLEDFAHTISHDLRNPLTTASAYLELAREDGNPEHFERIRHSLDRMERIIGDMLWLAKEGNNIGSTEWVNLREAIEDAWMVLNGRATRADLVFADEELGCIEADYNRLCQLLENTMRNAIEYGGPDVQIRIETVENGFAIEDDGPGIPEAEREKVFERGYSTGEQGTGFGLSIVSQIAEAHEWAVKLTEGQTGGARFEVTEVRVKDSSR